MLAKGIFEKVPVSVKLHPVLLKLLLGTANQINLEDLRIYDEQIYKSLLYLATQTNPSIFEDLEMKFNIMRQDGYEVELIPGGNDIAVTIHNI